MSTTGLWVQSALLPTALFLFLSLSLSPSYPQGAVQGGVGFPLAPDFPRKLGHHRGEQAGLRPADPAGPGPGEVVHADLGRKDGEKVERPPHRPLRLPGHRLSRRRRLGGGVFGHRSGEGQGAVGGGRQGRGADGLGMVRADRRRPGAARQRRGQSPGPGAEHVAERQCLRGRLWKDARRHGTGTFTHASGEVYVGEYEDGKKNGKGTYTYADGAVYVGEFNDNKRNGKGTYTYKSGNVEVGFYEQDKDKGRSVQLSADSKTAWLVMDGKVEREVSVAEAEPLSAQKVRSA